MITNPQDSSYIRVQPSAKGSSPPSPAGLPAVPLNSHMLLSDVAKADFQTVSVLQKQRDLQGCGRAPEYLPSTEQYIEH